MAAALFASRRLFETKTDLAASRPEESLRVLLKNHAIVVLLAVTFIAAAHLPAAIIWAALHTRLGGTPGDRFGRKPLLIMALSVAGAASLFVPYASNLVVPAVLWAAEAVCFAANDPVSHALVADLTGSDQRGRVYGLFSFAGGIGAVAGLLQGGWRYDNLSQLAPFLSNGIALAAGAAILRFGLAISLERDCAPAQSAQAK